ncbi:MAG: FecR domain-containing protein [Pedobacter sp.]|uniref:FecR family protein n=1 Tax=Pedobacter sp. TaxID=1411316 RepID=UPI00356641F1
MTKEEYILLYEKYLKGICTAEEQKLLDTYQDNYSLNFHFLEVHDNQKDKERNARIYQQLKKSIDNTQPPKLSWYKHPFTAAAALIGILSIGAYLFWTSPKINKQEKVLASQTKMNSGSNKAVLTLGDGSRLILDNASNGILTNQGQSVISKESNGKLVYNTSGVSQSYAVEQNLITIPRGGEYQIVLPDGTKVWLNSESSLSFPVVFKGNTRKVTLSGEAYFEVAKNKNSPFSISVKGTEIKVLGTHFNVEAYDDVNTTLVEGSVQLKNKTQSVVLKPGESGLTQNDGRFKIEQADLESVTGWKNGYFVFHNKELKSIMEQVERWYDVDIEYEDDVQDKKFYGKVSRSDDLSELLKNMELTGIVHFKIQTDNKTKRKKIIVTT